MSLCENELREGNVIALQFEKINNARDLGGIVTKDGSLLKTRQLLRTAALSEASPTDIDTLSSVYSLDCVIDLRAGFERNDAPDPTIPGARHLDAPLFTARSLGITQGEGNLAAMIKQRGLPDMPTLYSKLLAPATSERWQMIFQALLDPKNVCVLWHCANGKDRCGVVTAAILLALGVDRETIMYDYLLTNEAMNDQVAEVSESVINRTGKALLADQYADIMRAKPEYLQAAFDTIDEEYQGTEGFLAKLCGLGIVQTEALRAKFLQ